MTAEQIEPFADNWTYLRAELSWLDRVLMIAVAKHRKEMKALSRVAQSQVDWATSHWWKGIISLDQPAAYDERSPKAQSQAEPSGPRPGFQQQMQARIQASYQQGIPLGLPLVRDRLQLSLFEKNALLMGLAPEINRRYARIYSYLQQSEAEQTLGGEGGRSGRSRNPNRAQDPSAYLKQVALGQGTLPTLDLILRLLCRNDGEWRVARGRFAAEMPLRQWGLVELLPGNDRSFLGSHLKPCEPLVNYLLADRPEPHTLEDLLNPAPHSPDQHLNELGDLRSVGTVSNVSTLRPTWLQTRSPQATWADLVLPQKQIAALQQMAKRVQVTLQMGQSWNFDQGSAGILAVLAGLAGTGKTTAAEVLATELQVPLSWLDLDQISPVEMEPLLNQLHHDAPSLLLVKSARHWLSRHTQFSQAALHRFWVDRQRHPGLTLFSVHFAESVARTWQAQLFKIITFPKPDLKARQRLWQQSFPTEANLADDINWRALAQKACLTGREIKTIAQNATLLAFSSNQKISQNCLMQAIDQRHLEI